MGCNLLTVGIVITTLVTFYPAYVSRMIPFSAGPASVVVLGFFWGSLFGGAGTILTVFGFLLAERTGRRVRLRIPLLILFSAVIFFTILLYLSLHGVSTAPPQLRPGETITI